MGRKSAAPIKVVPVSQEQDATAASADATEGTLATDPLPSVKVNNANLGEMKSALDDIVKSHLASQAFTPSLLHPTIHLSLGYTSIILALGSALYSWKTEFEEAKPVLYVGVVGYFVFQGILWAWKRWVEKGEVFRGRRRRMVKRIETDHIQIITSTTLSAPPAPNVTYSPHTRPTSPTSSPSSPSSVASPILLTPSNSDLQLQSHQKDASNDTVSSSSSKGKPSTSSSKDSSDLVGPTYLLQLNLSTTSNNGKSLISKSRVVAGKGVGEFIDQEGGVEEGEVVRWLGSLLTEAGLVGAEEEGAKEE